jgi:hypothetical protein
MQFELINECQETTGPDRLGLDVDNGVFISFDSLVAGTLHGRLLKAFQSTISDAQQSTSDCVLTLRDGRRPS